MEVDLKPPKRTPVKDPKNYPELAICSINFKIDGKDHSGTGFLIGPKAVLTCAHNLHD